MSDHIAVKNHKQQKNSRHEFDVEVSPTKMAEYFNAAYEELAPSVEISGFRKGQAPKLMTIQKIGQERYFQTALDKALPNSYAEAMQSLKLRPVAPPEIAIKSYGESAPFSFSVAVDVIPDVDPGNYSKFKVKPPKSDTKVKQSEIDEVLEKLKKQQAETKPVERASKKGDRVEIDYVGSVGGVKRDDMSSQHFPVILGDGVVSKTFEKELEGRKKGDNFSFTDKVGKESVEFAVTVHEVAEVKLPEVNKKFAEQFGRKDAKDLKEAIEQQLQSEKEDAARRELEGKVLDALLKKSKVEIPASLVAEETNRRLESIKQQFGAMYDQFLKAQKKTEEEIKKEIEPEAAKSVKTGLVLGEIAKRENFGADKAKDEDDEAFQRRVVRRTINFLVASATGVELDKDKDEKEK